MEEWKVNVLGPIHVIQAALPFMVEKRKGSVINISSIKGNPNYSTISTFTYGQSKSAVVSMTKSLAKAYAEKGIRFNVVLPGYVETDMSQLWSKDTFERINNGTLVGRIAQPIEIASMVMFLASDESSYITGGEFLVDGGYSIKGK